MKVKKWSREGEISEARLEVEFQGDDVVSSIGHYRQSNRQAVPMLDLDGK